MVSNLRSFARRIPAIARLNTPTPSATARSIFHYHPRTVSCTGRRSLHTDEVPGEAPANQIPVQQISPLPEAPRESLNSEWRHPRFGFAAADFPHLLYIKLPRTATKDDVEALITRAGLRNVQIFMYYFLENGKPEDFCFLRFEDRCDLDTAIASLFRFTLLGSDVKPRKFSLWRAPAQVPNLLAGWLPSPSSDLGTRQIRPPRAEPPKILPTLMNGQWIQFLGIPVKLKEGDAYSRVAEAFYQQFHHLDVLGITTPRPHRKHGVCCKILFGDRNDARAARALHVQGKFMGKPGNAKTYRGGPEVHKALWDYRQTLPDDLPAEETQDLLEKRFEQIHPDPADAKRWVDYPTPESAVGVKDS